MKLNDLTITVSGNPNLTDGELDKLCDAIQDILEESAETAKAKLTLMGLDVSWS